MSYRVSINKQERTEVRTIGVGGAPSTRLATLFDVDASSPDENDVLVYDATTNKYVIKPLPNVDGGTF